MSVGYLCCPVDVLYCDLTLVCRPISDVLSNRAGEKNRLLQQTNAHTEMRKKKAGDFLALFFAGGIFLPGLQFRCDSSASKDSSLVYHSHQHWPHLHFNKNYAFIHTFSLLLYLGYIIIQVSRFSIIFLLSVLTWIRIIEPEQQWHQCGFAWTTGSHYCHYWPRRHRQT